MEENDKKLYGRILVHLLIVLTGILLLIIVFPRLLHFFAPLIVAWIIAMMANPLVHFLEKRIKIMRKHGSAIVIVLVLLTIVWLLYILIATLLSQVSSMVQALPDVYETVINNIQQALAQLHTKYNVIPSSIQNFFANNKDELNDYIMAALNSLKSSPVSAVGSVASSIIDMFVLSILTIMLSYFFIAENEKIRNFVTKHMPKSMSASIQMIKDTVLRAIGGYIKACFQIMIVMFLILFVFFAFMRVEYAALIALITAMLDFLPFIGTGTVIMPWTVYSIITGEYTMAVALVAAYLVTMIVRRLLEPKLVGDSIGMSPFLTLISMFIGYRLMGMLGLIVGIPVGMIIKVFYEEGLFDNTFRGIKILCDGINNYRKY